MAKTLRTYKPKREPRPSKYPWAKWLDGRTWKLTKGEDFLCSLASFADLVRKTAAARGLDVTVYTEDKAVVIVPRA